ncbi:MAG: hypothetical protein ACLUR5_16200 [Eubacterium ventriosum]
MKEKHLDNFVRGIKNGIPIAMGYLAVAFTLGIAGERMQELQHFRQD